MKVFRKSLVFLFLWNILLFLLAFLCLNLYFFIPALFCLIFFNLFLVRFTNAFIQKNLAFSHFPKDDFYAVSALFEEFKKKNPHLKVQLLKSESSLPFAWNSFQASFIALSEDFLETFHEEDIRCFFESTFQKIKKGELAFLSLLSSFLYLGLKVSVILSYPLFFKKKKKERTFLEKALIRLLSLSTKPLFYKIDQETFTKPEQKRKQAFFLWNLESFTRLKKEKIPLFLSPLYPIDPLLGYFKEKKPVSFHPSVKNRLKKLINSYPP